MRRFARWLVAATWIAVAPAFGAEAWAPAKKLDAYFDALARNDLTHGSIAISENGVLRYQRTVGFARIENGRPDPADEVTRYRIGSLTEIFTAALVMQLAEKASITLGTPLAEFYPDLPNALKLQYRDLLMHRSGLPDYADDASYDTWRRKPQTHAQLLGLIAARPARYEPRERVQYSSSDYLVLGYMLEKVYERPYEAIVRRQITDKLGLQRTYLAGTGSASLESQSYQPKLGSWGQVTDSDPSVLAGAAGMVSTAKDLVMFLDALSAGKLVTAQSLTSMQTHDGDSGSGLWPYEVAGQSGFGHRGGVDGFRAFAWHFPQRKLSIAYTSNASLLPVDELADEALKLIFERGRQPPALVPVKLSARQQAEYLGTWSSADGAPRGSSFRTFRAPPRQVELRMLASTDSPLLKMMDSEYKLVAFGDDEFLSRELGLFLRFYPRSGEMVSRGPDWAYYFRRAE